MCYSTMIEADLRKLERRFDAVIDWDNIAEAFSLRDNYKMASIPSAIDSYIIQTATTALEKKLAKAARAHYQTEIKKFSTKLIKYENDVLEFEKKIAKGSKAKGLKESLEKRRASVEWLRDKITHYQEIEERGAARIFPQFYAPVIIQEEKCRAIKLMRYHVLPASGKELIPFKYNLFNARRDNLMSSKIWKPLFGAKHTIYPFYRFYESVEGENGQSRIIYFEQQSKELMWSAALFEMSKIKEGLLYSFAAITDEPPSEVATTGHDRCPIFLDEQSVTSWLNPRNYSPMDLFNLLDSKTPTLFLHQDAA